MKILSHTYLSERILIEYFSKVSYLQEISGLLI